MSIHDHRGDRKQTLINSLTSPEFSGLRSVGSPEYTLFDVSSRRLAAFSPESVTTTGDGTDIGQALKEVRQSALTENIQAVILLTDGEFSVGTSPLYEAQELDLPVFTIGVGDSSEQKDVQVRRVLANSITYVGNRVPVNAVIKSTGFDGERTEITLQKDGVVLDRKVLALENGTREYPVPLSFIPAKEGVQKFTVVASQLPGELTGNNNAVSFFTKVLKSKMKVLLVAGGPSQDVAFLCRALQGDKNVNLDSFIEEKNGEFYGKRLTRKEVDDADCLVLVGYPNQEASSASYALIQEAIAATKPFMFVLSRTIDYQKLRSMDALLPFSFSETSDNEYQVFVAVSPEQRDNGILRLPSGSVDSWSKLAPVFRTQAVFRAKPEAEVLCTVKIQSMTTRDPLLISRNVNRSKSLALLAYGVWRWKMYGDPGTGTEGLLDEFLSNAVRWLTTREDDRPFRVQPVKSIFSGDEPIEFTGQLYDDNYKPVDNAVVQVAVTRGRQTNDVVLNSLGNGQYDGSLDRLEEGDYSYTAKAQQNGKWVGEDKGTFSVGRTNVEFLDTRMNKLLLRQIASQTGGKYYDSDSLSSLPKDIASLPSFIPREATRTREIELWNYKWTLALIVLLLSLEWFLRKRSGMI
jgi:hypothetical protein